MKNIIALTLASAALASAQATQYQDGTYKCAKPDAAYCAGDSLGTDIIIRCDGTTGQPGRCGNNLAGQPPLGVGGALCYQSSSTAGDAACVKNCVVYAPSGTWTLPASQCTPTYTASSSSSSSTSHSSTKSYPPTSTIIYTNPRTTDTTCSTPYTKPPVTVTTTECSTTPTPYTHPTYPHSNSTITTKTATPSSPLTPRPPVTTAGAASNKAMGGLAAVGLLAAYLL